MFKVEKNKSLIKITRGDIGVLEVTARNKNKSAYTFKKGDIVRLGVYEKNNYKSIKLKKDIAVEDETLSVDIPLTKEDTSIGNIINQPVDYWYEVQLNPDTEPQTIVGHDEDGAKIFRLYPEGVEE